MRIMFQRKANESDGDKIIPTKTRYHKYSGFVVFCLAFGHWCVASLADPGIVTQRNAVALTKQYKYLVD